MLAGLGGWLGICDRGKMLLTIGEDVAMSTVKEGLGVCGDGVRGIGLFETEMVVWTGLEI